MASVVIVLDDAPLREHLAMLARAARHTVSEFETSAFDTLNLATHDVLVLDPTEDGTSIAVVSLKFWLGAPTARATEAFVPLKRPVEDLRFIDSLSRAVRRHNTELVAKARAELVGRGPRVVVYGMFYIPEELRTATVGSALRTNISETPGELEMMCESVAPDLLLALVESWDAGQILESLHRILSRDPYLHVVVGGPAELEPMFANTRIDAYFAVPERDGAFLAMSSAIIRHAQHRYRTRTRFDADVRLRVKATDRTGYVCNISETGLAIRTKFPLRLGLHVPIHVDLGEHGQLVCRCRVVWTRWEEPNRTWLLGMSLEGLSEEQRNSIRQVMTPDDMRVPMRGAVQLRSPTELQNLGECNDLSAGGLGITVPLPVEVGRRIAVELDLPDGQGSLHERARVAWAAPRPDGGGWRLGLAFEELSDIGTQRVRAFVSGASE